MALVYLWLATFMLPMIDIQCLYEDQVGKFDWHHQYLGEAKFLVWDQSRQAGKRIFVGTEKSVISLINIQNGELVWRKVTESRPLLPIDALLHSGSAVLTLCGGGAILRNWNSGTGFLEWEQHLNTASGLAKSAVLLWANEDKDKVVVVTQNSIITYHVNSGRPVWSSNLPQSDTGTYRHALMHDGSAVVLGVVIYSHLSVLRYSSDGVLESQRKIPSPWITSSTECVITNNDHIVCFTDDTHTLHSANVLHDSTFTSTSLEELGLEYSGSLMLDVSQIELSNEGYFTVQLSPTQVALMRTNSRIELVKHFKLHSSLWLGTVEEKAVILVGSRVSDEFVALSAFDLASLTEITEYSHRLNVADFHGNMVKISPLFFKKRDGRMTYRAVLSFSDHSLQMVQSTGKIGWRREEALASVLSVEMVDLPVSENEAKFEDEFGSQEADVFAMFLKRVRTQMSQFKTFVSGLIHKLLGHKHYFHQSHLSEELEETEESELTRDRFNLHKMIIIVTRPGKIYGMLSRTGKIVWQQLLPDMKPFNGSGLPKSPLFVQRSSAHFPNLPQCVILGQHRVSGQGLLYAFNPVTGEQTEDVPPGGLNLPFTPVQVIMSNAVDDKFLKTLVMMDKTNKLHIYPSSHRKILSRYIPSLYLHTSNITAGLITGYQINTNDHELVANEVSSVNFKKSGQVITNIAQKRPIEHVHSQGRVLGDRNVLYKYLNPNLIAISTEGEDSTQTSSPQSKGPNKVLHLYLLDTVTGHIVFHTTHKRVSGPYHVVHSENWVVYGYYNQKSRRGELAVLELYEGNKQSNATTFSSFHAMPSPLVMRQAYIFSPTFSAIATSITEKGITGKTVLLALNSGGILSLQKAILDPRRPVIPQPEHMEEGTLAYMPEIPLTFDSVINYNQSAFNIHGIHTSPAGLESTCLVFAYGIDIFFGHVAPSKMFDVLNEEFDFLFISAVLSGMFLVSIITQQLASRKALTRSWK